MTQIPNQPKMGFASTKGLILLTLLSPDLREKYMLLGFKERCRSQKRQFLFHFPGNFYLKPINFDPLEQTELVGN